MKRGPEKRKVSLAPPKLQEAWVAHAAERGGCPFLAHELPGADRALITAMDVSKTESTTAAAFFGRDAEGRLTMEVVWVVEPEIVKKHKGKQK